jgi:excisionase family DNA binding protein
MEHLKVQDKTVRKWIKGGVLPAYQFRTEWRIALADAVAFVERARFKPL